MNTDTDAVAFEPESAAGMRVDPEHLRIIAKSGSVKAMQNALLHAANALAGSAQERCKCCGYKVTDSEHRGCLRSAEFDHNFAAPTASTGESTRDACQIDNFSSRACKYGTRSCISEHTAPAQSCGDAEQAAYSAPFTTDAPHCCGNPDTCNDPCEQISWTSAQLDALLEDADRLGKYKGFVSRTLFDCARVIREFRAAITGEKQAEQEADGPCCKGMAPSDDCWQECGGTKKRPSRAASTQAGLLDEQIIDEWVKRRFSDIPERHNPCKETIASEQADVPLRAAVESMVCMLENGEWAEHASTYKAPGDKLAARLEAAITDLHNELSGDSEQADEAQQRAAWIDTNVSGNPVLIQAMKNLADAEPHIGEYAANGAMERGLMEAWMQRAWGYVDDDTIGYKTALEVWLARAALTKVAPANEGTVFNAWLLDKYGIDALDTEIAKHMRAGWDARAALTAEKVAAEPVAVGRPHLAELHADAAYMFQRVRQGTLSPEDATAAVRSKIDAAQAQIAAPQQPAPSVEQDERGAFAVGQKGIDALFSRVSDWVTVHCIPFEDQNELFRILSTFCEQYIGQMAGISTAAMGYWKEGDSIHPSLDTVALRDVAKLYAKYAALHDQARAASTQSTATQPVQPHLTNNGLASNDRQMTQPAQTQVALTDEQIWQSLKDIADSHTHPDDVVEAGRALLAAQPVSGGDHD